MRKSLYPATNSGEWVGGLSKLLMFRRLMVVRSWVSCMVSRVLVPFITAKVRTDVVRTSEYSLRCRSGIAPRC